MTFKNALCLASIPEPRWMTGLPVRYQRCQRRKDHSGPHRSWSREWEDGDQESKARKHKEPR